MPKGEYMTTMASSIDMAFQAVFIALVIVAALIDLRTMRIPNKLVIALLALWAVRTAVMTWILPALNHAASGSLSSERLLLGSILFGSSVAGGLVLGGGTLLAFEKITHRPSFGGGDIKLLFAVGLWLGIGRGLACLLIACTASLVLAAVLPRLGWKPPASTQKESSCADSQADERNGSLLRTTVPFAPAIAIGVIVSLIWPL